MPNWSITAEPRGDAYRALVDAALEWGPVGGLVIRDLTSSQEPVLTFLQSLNQYIIGVEMTFEWPGTQIGLGNSDPRNKSVTDGPTLYKFSICAESLDLLKHTVSGLYEWLGPELPEDLCFFDHSGAVWMTSMSHERDAYLTLAPTQLDHLLRRVPSLQGRWDPPEWSIPYDSTA